MDRRPAVWWGRGARLTHSVLQPPLLHVLFLVGLGTGPQWLRSYELRCFSRWGSCYQIFRSLKLFRYSTDRN